MSDKHQITAENREAFEKRFAMCLASSSATAVKVECPFCGQSFYLPVQTGVVCPHCGEVELTLEVHDAKDVVD
jgi:Zn finger protein HypA/HybF involved in hydrogenase expression